MFGWFLVQKLAISDSLSARYCSCRRPEMKPRQRPAQEPDGLFKTPLARFIDMDQPLVLLADRIDWDGLASKVAVYFSKEGRPAVPARFMLGMLILKSMENLSDEELFTRWPRDPYYQYFTGELYFQHQVPHERSGLSHWREHSWHLGGRRFWISSSKKACASRMDAGLCANRIWRQSRSIRRFRRKQFAFPRMHHCSTPPWCSLVFWPASLG